MIDIDPDAALLSEIAAGDQTAIRHFVTLKLPRLLALGVRMLGNRTDAEDVAQETFMRVWKNAATWQANGAKFDTWMHRVALNLCYDKLRGRREYTDDEIPEQIDHSLIPEQHLEASQVSDQVTNALAMLPTRQREALVLQYYQEFSNIEAAKLMGTSIEALESLLSRARRNLKALLLQQGFVKEMI
jgi:RNA polymerase sigma-70 factor (ECF subfamily)